MKKIISAVFSLVFTTIISNISIAANFYVSPNGSSNTTCHKHNPCDIQSATQLTNSTNGKDILLLYPGTYNIYSQIIISDSVEFQGTSSSQVTIDASNNIDSQVFLISTNQTTDIVGFYNLEIVNGRWNLITSYSTAKGKLDLENVIFRNSTYGVFIASPDLTLRSSRNIFDNLTGGIDVSFGEIQTIKGSTFTNCARAIYLKQILGTHAYLLANHFEDNQSAVTIHQDNSSPVFNLQLNTFLSNERSITLLPYATNGFLDVEIEKNTFTNNVYGIYSSSHQGSTSIDKNLFEKDNTQTNNYLGLINYGIYLADSLNENIIKNNLFRDLDYAYYSFDGKAYLAFNTFNTNQYGMYGFTSGSGTLVANNIFTNNDYGHYNLSRFPSGNNYQFASNYFHNRIDIVDPNFVNLDGNNLLIDPRIDITDKCTPLASSPAINNANMSVYSAARDHYNFSRDSQNDIGACEFQP